jgi:hypothetical protein
MNLTDLTTATSLLALVLARARTLVPGLPVENSDRKVQVALGNSRLDASPCIWHRSGGQGSRWRQAASSVRRV